MGRYSRLKIRINETVSRDWNWLQVQYFFARLYSVQVGTALTGVEVFRVGLVVCVVLLWVSMTKVG